MARILLVLDVYQDLKYFHGMSEMYGKIVDYCNNRPYTYDLFQPAYSRNGYNTNPTYIDRLLRDSYDNAPSESLANSPKNGTGVGKALYECECGDVYEPILMMADRRKDIIHLIGRDACVMATASMLWDKGYTFMILTDYVYTTSKDFDIEDVIKLLKRNFGAWVI